MLFVLCLSFFLSTVPVGVTSLIPVLWSGCNYTHTLYITVVGMFVTVRRPHLLHTAIFASAWYCTELLCIPGYDDDVVKRKRKKKKKGERISILHYHAHRQNLKPA